MDSDEKDKLVLTALQVYEIECAVWHATGGGNAVFKYSSPGVITNCLNPLAVETI